jgi:hypothetical protein
MNKSRFKSKRKIAKIGIINDTLTDRGEVALFVKYLSSVEIYPSLQDGKIVIVISVSFW